MLRLTRVYRAFFAAGLKPNDTWARAWLKEDEWELYILMDPRDRQHSLEVAQGLLERYPQAPAFVVRAALLHDAGKALRPYRAIERILTGLWSPAAAQAEPLRGGIYGAWQVRRHHPQYAATRIADPQVAAIVREHHSPFSLWGKRLHEVDQQS
jgi:hypothetical protein